MKKNERLPEAILTPTTKAEKGEHDENAIARGAPPRGTSRRKTSTRPPRLPRSCSRSAKRAAERGLILVDTKYELGKTPDGQDRLHRRDPHARQVALLVRRRLRRSPRSGRRSAALDKEYVRRWHVDAGAIGRGPPPRIPDEVRVEAARRYIAAYERSPGALRPQHRGAARAHRAATWGFMMLAKVYVTLKTGRPRSAGTGRRARARRLGFRRSRTRASASTSSSHVDDGRRPTRSRTCARSSSPTPSSRTTASRS